jgi:hypothetical protein
MSLSTDPMNACDRSLLDAVKSMMQWQEGGRVVEERGMQFAIAGGRFPTPYSNAALPASSDVDPELLLESARLVFHDRRYFVWSHGEGGGGVGELARAAGFSSFGSLPAMIVESKVAEPEASSVQVSRARSEADFADFVHVSKCAYREAELPEPVAEQLLSRAGAALSSSIIGVARVDGRPAAAAVAITSSSKTVQPRHWTTLIAVGRYEPRSPSGARISTIAGTRACAPIAPATASIRFPTRQPTRIATSAVGSESAGTSTAPATITSSETPRFPHRRPMSTPPSTRSLSGTGSIPQDVSRSVTSGEGTAGLTGVASASPP